MGWNLMLSNTSTIPEYWVIIKPKFCAYRIFVIYWYFFNKTKEALKILSNSKIIKKLSNSLILFKLVDYTARKTYNLFVTLCYPASICIGIYVLSNLCELMWTKDFYLIWYMAISDTNAKIMYSWYLVKQRENY